MALALRLGRLLAFFWDIDFLLPLALGAFVALAALGAFFFAGFAADFRLAATFAAFAPLEVDRDFEAFRLMVVGINDSNPPKGLTQQRLFIAEEASPVVDHLVLPLGLRKKSDPKIRLKTNA